MQTIRDLLSRDLSQPIEEVIKLDQYDEKTVYDEITEYVFTDGIKQQYLVLMLFQWSTESPTLLHRRRRCAPGNCSACLAGLPSPGLEQPNLLESRLTRAPDSHVRREAE